MFLLFIAFFCFVVAFAFEGWTKKFFIFFGAILILRALLYPLIPAIFNRNMVDRTINYQPDFGGLRGDNNLIMQTMLHIESGFEYMKQDKYSQAEEEFKQSIQENPEFDGGYYGLGMVYVNTNRLDKAISIFNEGISNIGFNRTLFASLSIAYLKKGELENAEKLLKEILEINPDDAEVQRMFQYIQDLKKPKKEKRYYFLK